MDEDAVSITDIQTSDDPITCLTCYDYLTATVMDRVQGLDMVLVGDSLGMVELGYDSTIPVTLDDLIHHTQAVERGVNRAYLVSDIPFLRMAGTQSEAVEVARRIMQEGGAQALKIEGGKRVSKRVDHLTSHDIPVIGHLGLTPQSVEALGGYSLQATEPEDVKKLGEDARSLQESGVFALVLECIPEEVAAELTELLDIPTIGIGAGSKCDGQVLVWQDMMGLTEEPSPRFVREWGNLRHDLEENIESFCDEVRSHDFPSSEESFTTPDGLKGSNLNELLSP